MKNYETAMMIITYEKTTPQKLYFTRDIRRDFGGQLAGLVIMQ